MSTAADNHRDEELKLLGTKISALPQTCVVDGDVFIVNENDQNTKKIQYSGVKKIFCGDITFTGEITFLYPQGFTLNSLIDVQVINLKTRMYYNMMQQVALKPQSPELTQGGVDLKGHKDHLDLRNSWISWKGWRPGPTGPTGPTGPKGQQAKGPQAQVILVLMVKAYQSYLDTTSEDPPLSETAGSST